MAENKKSFVLYADLIHTVRKMKKEDAGELLLHILSYVNDENPETDNLLVDLTFEPIKQQFKRDLKKWEKTVEKRSNAGKASAEARKKAKEIQHNSTNSTHVNFVEHNSTNPTVNVNDTVNVNVNVNDNVTVSTKVDVVDVISDFDDEFLNFKIMFVSKKEKLDIDEEISKIQKKLDFAKNENEKIHYSDCINFLFEEKRKKVPPKKENNYDFAQSLKSDEGWVENMVMQYKSPPLKITSKLEEFLTHLKTDFKEHPSRSEFIRHFKAWLSKNLNNGESKSISYDTKKQFRFSTDEAIKTIVSGS